MIGLIIFVVAIVALLVVLAGDARQLTSTRKGNKND
jgi:hypothetical protein